MCMVPMMPSGHMTITIGRMVKITAQSGKVMARTFTQLTYEQRVQIKQMLDQGISKRLIAETIGVHHSTVYREIERGTVNETYDPEYAEKKYQGNND